MDYKYFYLKIQSKIDEVIDNFDFEKVHDVMEDLNWTWAHTHGVPELPELKSFARQLLRELFEYDTDQISSGGFIAQRDETDNLELSFVIENYYTEG